VAAVVEERYQSSDHQNRYFDWDKPSGFDSLELVQDRLELDRLV